MSCMIDGIQISSCCTMGKGNIEIAEDRIPEVLFHDRQTALEMSLRKEIWEMIESETIHETEEAIAMLIDSMEDDSLFDLKEVHCPNSGPL